MTNQEFGERVGVTHSMASRIRSGHRLPSTGVLVRIHEQFGVPLQELMDAHQNGCEAFGRLIRERCP